MYEVLIERRAERDMRRLSKELFSRVASAIQKLAENPRPVGCRKLSGSVDDWRIRIGNYRVLYEIDDPQQKVRIMRVRHRRDVYRL